MNLSQKAVNALEACQYHTATNHYPEARVMEIIVYNTQSAGHHDDADADSGNVIGTISFTDGAFECFWHTRFASKEDINIIRSIMARFQTWQWA